MTKTFLELPEEYRDPKTARFWIVPVPYEGTVCFLKGTAAGPDAILSVSDQMEHFDEETHTEIFRHGIYTMPPLSGNLPPAEQMEYLLKTVRQYDLFAENRFPIFLGGEHSITGPIVTAACEKYTDVSVLQFDAHADLRQSFTGTPFSHASVMRRVLETTPRLHQVGIRSFSHEEFVECPEQVRHFVTPELIEETPYIMTERLIYGLTENVYITFDMDAFDPSVAPGVGTPEPGGLTWRQVTRILKSVFLHRNVIGADIVETCPLGGQNIVTEFLAARLVGKLIALAGQWV